MNPSIVAKFEVSSVEKYEGQENWTFMAVTSKPFDALGQNEDNSFARWTPCGNITMTVQNPALLGRLERGKKFRVYFEEVNE